MNGKNRVKDIIYVQIGSSGFASHGKHGRHIGIIASDQYLVKGCIIFFQSLQGAQWLSDRVLDSRSKGCGFEPHQRHCVVSLSRTH